MNIWNNIFYKKLTRIIKIEYHNLKKLNWGIIDSEENGEINHDHNLSNNIEKLKRINLLKKTVYFSWFSIK